MTSDNEKTQSVGGICIRDGVELKECSNMARDKEAIVYGVNIADHMIQLARNLH